MTTHTHAFRSASQFVHIELTLDGRATGSEVDIRVGGDPLRTGPLSTGPANLVVVKGFDIAVQALQDGVGLTLRLRNGATVELPLLNRGDRAVLTCAT